jgi:hypothetical protein
MSGVRSAAALRRLYERYRTATGLRVVERKPGELVEWLVLEPGSEDVGTFEQAFGVTPAAVAGDLAPEALNGALHVLHELDIRVAWRRFPRKTPVLAVRFFLVPKALPRGAKKSERVWPARSALPRAAATNVEIDFGEKPPAFTAPVIVDGVPMTMPDGSPIPDYSATSVDELRDSGALDRGEVGDAFVNARPLIDALSRTYDEVAAEQETEDEAAALAAFLDDEIGSMEERFRSEAELRSDAPPITVVEEPTGSWAEVSEAVVTETLKSIRLLRDKTGHLLVLAPSPSTGKTHAMMQAAAKEQVAGRTVGFAVFERKQIGEAKARLEASGPNVRLLVIEGRHKGNCLFMDEVTVATNAGFSPGTTVCPKCPRYHQYSKRNRDMCLYYRARMDAWEDREKARRRTSTAAPSPPKIILTTHASAVQGSHIATRYAQSFWNFDTLFIDEDPTEALVSQLGIREVALVYEQKDGSGRFDDLTIGTMVLRAAMVEARRQRAESATHGYADPTGEKPDPVHTRQFGSSYASGDLYALLEGVTRKYNRTLMALSAAVSDAATLVQPAKGEIMYLDADEVAKRFPNRHLAPFFEAIHMELTALEEAKAKTPAGIAADRPYRAHLDLVTNEETGEVDAVASVHVLRSYANGRTNIVLGDAYANAKHYESLFDRGEKRNDQGVVERENKVDVIRRLARWPTTSMLFRVIARASNSMFKNDTQFDDHLNTLVRQILELERGRQILFYTHKDRKTSLRRWLEAHADELDIREDFAIEHWGSGRGKDIYKNFQSFIGVTEYVPNKGSMIHESNTLSSLAPAPAPGKEDRKRVAFWNPSSERRGKESFVNGIGKSDPFLQTTFHRRATDELAQAVHRIRPAIPTADGSQKRCYAIGHLVPWSSELIAATSATVIVDNGKDDVDLETGALGRGARFEITETLALMSEREVARAIGVVFQGLGCWSNMFVHALLAAPSLSAIEDAFIAAGLVETARDSDEACFTSDLSSSGPTSASSGALVERVRRPSYGWASIAQRIIDTSRIYRAGRAKFLIELAFPAPRRHRASWMPQGSRGYEFWGDRDRFEKILNDHYGPVPF